MGKGWITWAAPLALAAGCAVAETLEPDGTRHASSAYGFAVTIPAPYEVKEHSPEALSVGRPTGGGGFDPVAELRLMVAGEGADYPSFETFALAALRNACAADGPGESIWCGAAEQRQPFATAAGAEGEVLYLKRVHERFEEGRTEVDGFGPVFLFDLSAEVPGDGWAALAVQPPATFPAAEVDSVLLRQLADSLAMRPGADGG